VLILPMRLGAFQSPKPSPGGLAPVFPGSRTKDLLASCYARRLPVHSGSHTVTLYIGVTSNLYVRVLQHKEGTLEGFTATYGCERLLYFEGYEDIRTINPEF